MSDTTAAHALVEAVSDVDGLADVVDALGCGTTAAEPWRAAVADFVLEGLCALRKISRTDEGRLLGTPPATKARHAADPQSRQLLDDDDEEPVPKGKKKYYN